MPAMVALGNEIEEVPELLRQRYGILECPMTGSSLTWTNDGLVAETAGYRYRVDNGIPNLFAPNDPKDFQCDVTEIVKKFYEENPFPNYDELDSRHSLSQKARRSILPALLDDQIPRGALILEAGCGTGQLTNFLAMSKEHAVIGGDMCLNSLKLAKTFRDKFLIKNAAFVQMNLFRPPFRNESFDMIIANGALHHTADAKLAFVRLLQKLKPGGIVFIGLYNAYGRLPTLWKRWLFDRFGSIFHFLDPRLLEKNVAPDRLKAWFMDQYNHPHESRHSQGEVLEWFDGNNIEFLCGIPHLDYRPFSGSEALFTPHSRGTAIDRFYSQMELLLGGGKDGGLFVMIGKKR